jgi:hypothetical protein
LSSRLIVLLAACSGAPAPQPAVANATTLPARATPAPRVSWSASEHRFVVERVPAAATDGKLAVVAIEGGDGGRGYPNLRIEVRDRDDRIMQTIPIIAANDWERLAPDGNPGPELDKRVAAANRALAGLPELVLLPKLGMLGERIATDGNIHVEWDDGLLLVIRQPAADAPVQNLARRHDPTWLAPRAGNCENESFLAGGYYRDGGDLAVVEIGYRGTDMCWEPAPQWHVVTWQR